MSSISFVLRIRFEKLFRLSCVQRLCCDTSE